MASSNFCPSTTTTVRSLSEVVPRMHNAHRDERSFQSSPAISTSSGEVEPAQQSISAYDIQAPLLLDDTWLREAEIA